MKHSISATAKLLAVLTLTTCAFAQEEDQFAEAKHFMELAEKASSCETKTEYRDNAKALIDQVEKLSSEKQRKLYETIRSIIEAKHTWKSATNAEIHLVGAILDKSKDNDLAVEILKTTPPSTVGMRSLEEYLSTCPVPIIAQAIRESAEQNRKLRATANKAEQSAVE